MTIRELLAAYYKGLARRTGWEAALADDFRFIGGNMTKQTPAVGKDNYVGIIQRLSQVFGAVRVVKSFVDRDEAFVLASYDWVFPHAVNIQGSVAELWKAKDGKLQERTIFFDTGSFDRLAKG
jgi:hypothetical protein